MQVLLGSGENADGDGQIETAPLGRLAGQVDRDVLGGDESLEQGAAHLSRDSFTEVSGSPTMLKAGSPLDKWTSTVTCGAAIPRLARL